MNLENLILVRNSKKLYHDGDNVIKIFNEDVSKADVLNEALNQARIEETGLNIPKIKGVTTLDGKWGIVSEYIKGKTLTQLMQENPEKLSEYINLFVDLQLEMHSKECPELHSLKNKMIRKIRLTEFDATTRYELHSRVQEMPTHKKLCHGDFNPSNIIITDDGTPFILDWSHATQGNASYDVARTYLLFTLANEKDQAEMYLNTFIQKSGIEKEYIQQWMPIVAATQSVKCIESERDLLLSWVNLIN